MERPLRTAPDPTESSGEAERHASARSARAGAVAEDYVEIVADLLAREGEARATDIARRLGVSHATAVKTLGRLKRDGLVRSKPYRGVFLTEAGETLARRVKARHEIVLAFLLAINVPRDAAEADAEGIEHYVSDATLEAFARHLRTAAGK
jgi:DtxR family manganese transport transcriptional regulator